MREEYRPLGTENGVDFRFSGTNRSAGAQTIRTFEELMNMRTLVFASASLLIAGGIQAQPANPTPFQQRVIEAMQGEIRTAEERERDANRMPAEVLEFFRMREDMRVIEILPAGGWYTKILAPVLQDSGKLYVSHPPGFYADAFAPVADLPGLEDVEQIDWGATPAGGAGRGRGGAFSASGEWDVEPVDLVLTFRNYHNFSVADRMAVNDSVFDALKPGGYYGIVDHTRRHMEPDAADRSNGRRVDPVLTITEVEDAGFDFVDFSDLLYRPQDELLLEVGNAEVSGQTDRYTLLFRKPE
jgi:predicted methyltransferase